MQCKRCSKELVPEFKGHSGSTPWENALNITDLQMTVSPGYGEFVDDFELIPLKSWSDTGNTLYFCHDCAVILLSFFAPDEQQIFHRGHQQLGDCTPECPYGFTYSEDTIMDTPREKVDDTEAEMDKLWDAAETALTDALKANYNLCAEQETDNVYIPGWLVDISALLVDGYRSGKLVKDDKMQAVASKPSSKL